MCVTLIFVLFYAFYSVNSIDTGHYYSMQRSHSVFEYHYCSFTYENQQIQGECKSFKQCPGAIDFWKARGVDPVTCWYDGLDHIVCCPEKMPLKYLPSITPTITSPPRTTGMTISATAKNTNGSINKILSFNQRRPASLMNTTTTFESLSTTPARTSTTLEMRTTTEVTLTINNECPIPNSSINGTCRDYSDCLSANKIWRATRTYPEICQGRIVCCLENGIEFRAAPRLTRSEMYCEDIYGAKFGAGGFAGGIATKPMEFPYMVGLGWNSELDNSTTFRCGGVLITATFVLTAAHCTSSRGQPPVRVKVGGDNLTDTTIAEMNISQIYVHPMYNSSLNTNDIALIRMEGWFRKEFACLWNERNLEMNNLTALGYGNIRFAGPSSDQLIKALLFSVPTSECQASYDEQLLDTHMCAGNSKNDTCQGDSGGPLLMYRDSKFYPYVVGITSFGNPCGGDSPGVYTRVSEFIDWIEDIVWS